MGAKLARGFALFVNWFNGVCAVVCGGMMVFADALFPGNTDSFMPLSMFDAFPFHDVFFTSLVWPGIALMLVNGVPNLVALAMRFAGKRRASYAWGMAAGAMLVVWTLVEMVYMPNPASVAYMVLGALQLAASWNARSHMGHSTHMQGEAG